MFLEKEEKVIDRKFAEDYLYNRIQCYEYPQELCVRVSCEQCKFKHDSSAGVFVEVMKVALWALRDCAAVSQIRWERDTAVEQLQEIGKALGEDMEDIKAVLNAKEMRGE